MATAATRARLKVVLIDLSGTIHIDDLAIPGAIEAVQRLRKTSVKVKFVTNTTKESLGTLHDRLTRIGFDIQRQEMFTSLTAARNLLKELGCRPMLLLQEDAKQDFKDICTDDPNSVVVGLSPDCFNYDTMNTAFRLVLEGSPLIAIHKARYYKKLDGLVLGPGPFVEALEYATGVKASIVGKPETTFFMKALEELGCKPEEAVMIGDDVQGDVGGAQRAGIKGFLVKTGKYRPNDEETISPPPASVCEHFPAVVDLLIKDYL